MRLLNAHNLGLVEFFGEDIPDYAILSHTWGKDEVTIEDIRSGNYKGKEAYKKIRYTLDEARRDRLDWAWIDTCMSSGSVAGGPAIP